MSNAVYPTLPGLTFGTTRTPVWSTTTKIATSLRDYQNANASYPQYRYKLSYEVLRQTPGYAEMATLVGFFNARQGGFDSFLFVDPDDNYVTRQAIGTGDGASVQFQLVRMFGGFVEPVFDLAGAPSVYVAGTLKTPGSDYTANALGLLTFAAAPAAGAVVTWTGGYYRRVRFAQDSIEFMQFLHGRWDARTVELMSKKP